MRMLVKFCDQNDLSFQMLKDCFEIFKVVSLDWLGLMTIVILFRQENVVRAGLICHPIDEQLLYLEDKL